jgi:hypothetical protein
MGKDSVAVPSESFADFIDTKSFWVIWQVSKPIAGGNRIRRISQDYPTESRALADAERYRKSGAVTWVEEARPLAPANVPQEALESLRAVAEPAAGLSSIGAAAE